MNSIVDKGTMTVMDPKWTCRYFIVSLDSRLKGLPVLSMRQIIITGRLGHIQQSLSY